MGTSPYEKFYFCATEGLYIKKEDAVFNKNGTPLCPIRHRRRALRVGPRNSSARAKRKVYYRV